MRQTVKNDSNNVEITKAYSDQSTVVVFLMTAGSIFAFYAINGLRFNKFSIGPVSGESKSGQGSTAPIEPSPQSRKQSTKEELTPITKFNKLKSGEKKVLRTLWRYQRLNFLDAFDKRWTFKIFANTPDYPEFLLAVSALLKRGLVSVNPENDQCALTNDGIWLMRNIGDNADVGDYYLF